MSPQLRLPLCTHFFGASRAGNAILKRLPRQKEANEISVLTDKYLNELPVFKTNNLMHMYAKRGSMSDALHVFNKMPKRDVASWNIMILGYANLKEGARALEMYAQMHQEGVQPSERTFAGALKACSSIAELEVGKQADMTPAKLWCLGRGRAIHFHVVKSGFLQDVLVGNTLVNMYAKCGSMGDARRVFDELHHPDVVTWNTMILGYTEQEESRLALELYGRMQKEGFTVVHRTFVGALKACSSPAAFEEGGQVDGKFGKIGCLMKGRGVHSQVIKHGLESDVFVGTSLVNMYVKCENMEDACCAFDGLPQRNVVTWTTMILGYAEQEESYLALDWYARMHQEGVQPNGRTFVAVLKACSSLSAPKEGKHLDREVGKSGCVVKSQAVHAQVVRNGFDLDASVGNNLVNVYVKCGSMEDARWVFDRLRHRDVARWTTMIMGYAEQEDSALALELYNWMWQEGVQPNDRTYVGALKACGILATLEGEKFSQNGCLAIGKNVHSQIVKSAYDSDLFVGTTLVNVYAKCRSMEDARCVFNILPHRNVVTWTTMILGYAEQENSAQALDLYALMHHEGIMADERASLGALKACSSLEAQEEGKQIDGKTVKIECLPKARAIHSQIVKRGFQSDVFLGNSLMSLYVKCGSMEDARRVFDELPHRDVVRWTTMILGYVEQEDSTLALELYAEMLKEGVIPDHRSFVSPLKACSSLEEGKQLQGKFRTSKCLTNATEIHSHIIKSGFESDVFVGNTLVNMYMKCGSMDDAHCVFDELPHRNVVTWTTMILGYAEQEGNEEAFKLYAQMQGQGVSPSDITFVAVLKACGNTAALEVGKELHRQISSVRHETSATVATGLIAMYAKCGSMVDALQLFHLMPKRDVVLWSALIAGYARQGESEHVFHLLEKMSREGIQPNGITFLSVLTVCNHVGLVEQGKNYFQAMSNHYGITPTIEHYSCLVDLLGRAGRLDEAITMLDKMPLRPDVVIWLNMLGACQNWKNIEIGRDAFENAVKLDENICAAYVMMANTYVDAQVEEEMVKIQVMKTNTQAWTLPEQNWLIDLTEQVPACVVGEKRHSQRKDICIRCTELPIDMEEGWVPHLEPVLQEICV